MTFQNNIERAEQSTGGAGMTRRFTNADLENLTEGTKPGPWVNSGYGIGPLYADIHGGVVSENHKDEELAAAAPELVADLRRVLTELEEWLLDEQELIKSMDPTDPVDKIVIIGAQHNIKNIQRILGEQS